MEAGRGRGDPAADLEVERHDQRRMLAGEQAAAVLPEALDNARQAFAPVERGLGDYPAAAS
ncbi:hypothetical protein ACFVVX_06020 [Kitasatospora sp. NPDC058170]|uniref:hypothetical protein n=1 Tax=Kitasatospora sp. NPDC058170 TaxID=3346364 RepID=UPI0036DBD450